MRRASPDPNPNPNPNPDQADLAPLLLQLAAWGGGVSDAQVLLLTMALLTMALLTMALLTVATYYGVSDAQVLELPWLTPPPSAGLAQARRLLGSIGALRSAAPTAAGAATTEGAGGAEAEAEAAPMAGISRHGEGLARLPTHPR